MKIIYISILLLFYFEDLEFIMGEKYVTISKGEYGEIMLPEIGSTIIEKYTLENKHMKVEIITYGSTIISIKVPDRKGNLTEIALGFDNINGYLFKKNPYAGATVGRVANRISNGSFKIGDKTYNVSRNIGCHTLHGGIRGFDKKLWKAHVELNSVVMTYKSEDMEEGFPGNVLVEIRYSLTPDNQLVIVFKAVTDEPTPVNIVNHSYFNLAGVENKANGLYEHFVQINGDEYTPLTEGDLLPTGEIKKVESTYFDLRKMENLGKKIKETPSGEGFDINYVIRGKGFRQVARLFHPPSGRYMEVLSDQPGVQFYTGNSLDNILGRDGIVYEKHSALCFETQKFPDAVNHDTFPSIILMRESLYTHTVSFVFGVKSSEDFLKNQMS